MKNAIVIFNLVALILAIPKIPQTNSHRFTVVPTKSNYTHPKLRIIDGQEATPHSIPYQAILEFDNGNTCGGSLISQNYVLTSAFCAIQATQVYITLGAHDLSIAEESAIHYSSNEIIIHEDFTSIMHNNIAVIRLPEPVDISPAVQPIYLPSRADDIFIGQLATVSGWGGTAPDQTFDHILHFAQVQVVSNEDCQTVDKADSTILCSVGTNNPNSGICGADVGGPLVTSGVQIGIATFIVDKCGTGYPSGYTKVTSYLGWIASHTDLKINSIN